MESTLHKHLKKQALYWLKDKMVDLCANEVKLFVRRKKVIADAVGINMKRKETRIIEVKATLSDFRRDDVLHSPYGYHAIADYAYLMTPVGLIPDDELPKGYGLLEVDEFDNVTVKKRAVRNPKPSLTLDTHIKRTGRAATNAVVYQELSKETKDDTAGAFSRGANIHLISATCPSCKKRNKYLIVTDQEEVTCSARGCKEPIPLKRARVHSITSYNDKFLKQLQSLMK
ncbi:MmcB family DNA repair protein [Bacillus alkalicellulosilyticus]|uniref:MmcB family DNA repair protein n=1 Tax=Alkalihalobacterium alkalicellulosilyticum TaxID=1912214 RepID=UPI000996FDC7|nr:MmcB family DNA repair protein [Bacillus alkalicellulosilyticus]